MGERSVTLGCTVKTGHAVAVALTTAPALVGKWSLVLAGKDQERFVFHAAQDLTPAAATRWVRDSERRIAKSTTASVAAMLRDLDAEGCRVDAAAVIGETIEDPAPVAKMLASHSGLHTGEGVLYRRVLVDALQRLGVECELVSKAMLPDPTVLAPLGKVPPPWRAEHKQAACAALSRGRAGGRGSAPRTVRAATPRRRA